MALIECKFFSDVLGMCCSMNVILPQRTTAQIGLRGVGGGDSYPTLYLLHGLSDDHSIWLRRTSIERYVAELGLAVVMPCVHRGFYTDMKHGLRYWTFISEELPRVCRSFFKLSAAREHNFAVGLSMGGYGAFKLGLRCPEKFAAVASLSGALVLGRLRREWKEWDAEFRTIFGPPEEFEGSENDLLYLARQLAESDKPKPKFYAWCGTDDSLYEDNQKFRRHAVELDLDYSYEESPGGHDWACWDRQIQRVLEWLPLPQD